MIIKRKKMSMRQKKTEDVALYALGVVTVVVAALMFVVWTL